MARGNTTKILKYLLFNDLCTYKEIAENCGLSVSTVIRCVNDLSNSFMIQTIRGKGGGIKLLDNKKTEIILTDQEIDMLAKTLQKWDNSKDIYVIFSFIEKLCSISDFSGKKQLLAKINSLKSEISVQRYN